MNIKQYDLKTLLLAAIKSEIESREIYQGLARRVKNAILKDRLEFLAKEEEKHKSYLEEFYRRQFPGEEIKVPQETPVPLPQVDASENRLLSAIVEDAMQAELAAKEFYEDLKTVLPGRENSRILQILADMEQLHYDILSKELENIKNFEDYAQSWDMIHVGP